MRTLEIYDAGGDYYLRLAGSTGALRWSCRDGDWRAAPEKLPAGLQRVELPDLPPPLREEILAFAARAEAIGNQTWSAQN